jgi:hypothetical protein
LLSLSGLDWNWMEEMGDGSGEWGAVVLVLARSYQPRPRDVTGASRSFPSPFFF